MKRYALLLLLIAGAAAANTPPTVTHLYAQQLPNTQEVRITYSVADPDNDPLTIRVYLLDSNGVMIMQCTSVTGAVGSGIMPGSNKTITWNAGIDFPGQYGTDYTLRVVADDGHTPVGFVYIPPGTFTMGSPANEPQRRTNEGPQHQVTLTKGFYMSKYEVTEEWWAEVMNQTPTTSQLPKSHVSWDLAVQFCNALSVQQGLTPAYTIHGTNGNVTWNQSANGYRLPTEAEWEYACRAGTTLAFHNNTNCLSSDTEANYDGRYPLTGCPTGVYRGARTVVGSFPSNQWGLHDMHGNLWEWVWCGLRTYTVSPQVDPVHNVGPGAYRVFRGGSWYYGAQCCRSAFRSDFFPLGESRDIGFRPVRSVF